VIALIDYGAGNLTSVRKALAALGAEFATPRSPEELANARGIIVPGVGHFEATRAIDVAWRQAIGVALDRGVALLGICLGMQWLFEGSNEAADVPGLATFKGVCERLPESSTQNLTTDPTPFLVKVPHVGWNSLDPPHPTALLQGVEPGAHVYFTHSYAAPAMPDAAATTTHGITFTSAIERGRLTGVQFHPEKSGPTGLRILRNWLHAV
jgi:imidazole glycerol-phosphate synthase subunit HisH